MPLVLALEPDLGQAEALVPILERVGAELVLARSRDDAVRALALRLPDLILVSALLSPRDEAEFTSYLQTLPDTAHLQTLSIPILAKVSAVEAPKRRRFGIGRLMSKETLATPSGCAPDVFADEIRAYLDRAGELRTQVAARVPRSPFVAAPAAERDQPPAVVPELRPHPSGASPGPVQGKDRSPAASSTYWAWDDAPVQASIPVPEPFPDSASPADEAGVAVIAAAREEAEREHDAREMAERTLIAREESLIEQVRAERQNRDDQETELRAREQAALAEAERTFSAREESLIEQARAERQTRDERETELRGREEAALAEAERQRNALEAAERGFAERERAAEARAEAERIVRDEAERARIEHDRLERAEHERLAREAAERAAQEKAAREAEERVARERAEHERSAREAAERADREQVAREQEARERLAREEAERERAGRESAERALAEAERLAREEAERLRERERVMLEQAERERLAREAAERERQVLEEAARELAERERIAREDAERERAERERLVLEQAERERVVREEAERVRLALEQAAQELAERERVIAEAAARERLAQEEADRERERLAAELAERERVAQEDAERERLSFEQAALELAERERLAREEAERERAAREAVEHEMNERERLAREAADLERAALEQAARELADRERLAREDAERERLARETAERELAAREAAAQEQSHRDRRARKKAERERLAREKSEQAAAAQADRLQREQRPQKRGSGGPLVLVQPDGTYVPADTSPAEAASGREEAERELAARQAEREHIHRERVVRELTVQAEALAQAVKAAQKLGTVAPQGHSQRATRREDAPARRDATRSRGEGAHPPIGGDVLHSPAFDAGSDEPVSYDALSGGQDDVDTAAPPDLDTAPMSRRAADAAATGGVRPQRERPAPLVLWAHRGHYGGTRRSHAAGEGREPNPGRSAALSDLHAILKELNIPPALAEIGYAAGCKIKRVRVRRRPGPRPVEKNASVVILSRRALERLRPVPDRGALPDAAVARR